MKVFTFESQLWLPCPRGEVFCFFSNAHNLQAITPHWLDFKILTPAPIRMKVGTLIDYQIQIHLLPVRWQTEITAWEPDRRFVDQQRRGPYRLWIHEHRFDTKDRGTTCTDHVRYAVPGGELMHRLFVRRELARIFAFRAAKLRELFVGGISPQLRPATT